ncbi:hypothetical protein ACFQGX_32470 [Nonomuraea dietziae]|uniref:hypothetical protein n=1 Tax=Nonomuraea dietziae TaxID=65515 RepID=UPI0036101B74
MNSTRIVSSLAVFVLRDFLKMKSAGLSPVLTAWRSRAASTLAVTGLPLLNRLSSFCAGMRALASLPGLGGSAGVKPSAGGT